MAISRLKTRSVGDTIVGADDDADFDNIIDELNTHTAAASPHTNHLITTGDTMTGTLTVTITSDINAVSTTSTATTATSLVHTSDSLTTGGIASYISDSADTGTRTLWVLANENTLATGAICASIRQDSDGDMLQLFDGANEEGFVDDLGQAILKIPEAGFVNNLGLDLSAGILKVTAADGTDLSSTNFATIAMPSQATSGLVVTLKVTDATHLFEDDSGTSDIVGEQFGVTTGVAWGNNRPFGLYMINGDDTDSGVRFAISPAPNLTVTPATANIGWHGNPMATPSDSGMFFLTDTDPSTSHDAVPCMLIGTIEMQMSASDDWTVQSLSTGNGMGVLAPFQGTEYDMPTGQQGAASGKYFADNAGTAPAFNNNSFKYTVGLDGYISVIMSVDDCSTAGVGAVDCQVAFPYQAAAVDFQYGSIQVTRTGGTILYTNLSRMAESQKLVLLGDGTTTTALTFSQNSVFDVNANNLVRITQRYKAF